MKKATRPEEQSRPHKVDSSTPENGLLQPRVQMTIKQALAAEHGWKSVGLKPAKGRRAMRRSFKKIGIPPKQIEAVLAAMGLGVQV